MVLVPVLVLVVCRASPAFKTKSRREGGMKKNGTTGGTAGGVVVLKKRRVLCYGGDTLDTRSVDDPPTPREKTRRTTFLAVNTGLSLERQ